MDIQIRKEEPKDVEQVRAISLLAFPTEIESRLDEILGTILFSSVSTSPAIESKGLGLAPVAVRPDVESPGVGAKLIREGLRLK